MSVSYTHSGLPAELAFFSTCHSGLTYGEMGLGVTDMNLDYDARGDGEYGEGPYWEKVKYMLCEAIVYLVPSEITKVIVWGDTAAEPKFMEVLREAIEEVMDCKQPELITHNPVFSGARGAAEFAMKAPGEMESMFEVQGEL